VSDSSAPDADEPDEDSLVGAVLDDRYLLTDALGEGGMGVVYRGQHTRTERPVAVKVLRSRFAADPRIRRRFVREAKAAATLAHPNVVDVLDYGVAEDGTAFQVLELLEGESLGELLERREVLAPDRAIEILLPVMSALRAAHERGVVHRDLKPDNIFVSTNALGRSVPKLLDFGIAKVMPREGKSATFATRVGAVMGTPSYMSPEQARGATDDIGPATDVWAIGVILFECLSGRLPFEADTPSMVMAHVMMQRAPSLGEYPGVPEALVEVVDRALSRDIGARFASMQAMIDALVEAAQRADVPVPELDASDGRPLSSRPPPRLDDSRRIELDPTVGRTEPKDAATQLATPRAEDEDDAVTRVARPRASPAVASVEAPVAAPEGPRASRGPLLVGALVALALAAAAAVVATAPWSTEPAVAEPTPTAAEPAAAPEPVAAPEPPAVAEPEPPAQPEPAAEPAPTPEPAPRAERPRPARRARPPRPEPEPARPAPEPRAEEPESGGGLPGLTGW